MLSLESLTSSTDLVALLADKGVTLRPIAGSPIFEAVMATRITSSNLTCLSELDGVAVDMHDFNIHRDHEDGGILTDDIHTAYMDEYSDKLADKLAGQIAVATGPVLTAVGALAERLMAVKDIENREGPLTYKVLMDAGEPMFDISSFASEVEKFEGVRTPSDIPLVLDYKPHTDDEIMALLTVGSEQYDTAVAQLIANIGMDEVRRIWRIVFEGDRGGITTYNAMRNDARSGAELNMLCFMFSLRLLSETDGDMKVTGLSGMSTSKYKSYLRGLLEISGVSVFSRYKNSLKNNEHGRLFARIDGKQIYCNKAVYDRYIADDGDVEVILGAVISGNGTGYVSDLVENKENYQAAWDANYRINQQSLRNNQLVDSRRCIVDFVRSHVRETEDQVVKANADRVLKNISLFVDNVYIQNLTDSPQLALTAMSIVYNHTDVFQILDGVTQCMAADSDISMEDALNMSLINYTACWFASQIEIEQ